MSPRPKPAAGAERRLGRLGRFEEIRRGHMLSWAHLWERLSSTSRPRRRMRILRMHLLHLLQTVSYNTEDLDVGVPARGLHGEAYRGHVFWDELFIFPVLNLRLPTVTRSLLRYRYRRLPEARRAAKAGRVSRRDVPVAIRQRRPRGKPAAASESAIRAVAAGSQPSCPSHRHRRCLQHWKFYQVTGDLAYLIDYGAEMLAEIARFWVSRVAYEPERDRYSMNGVIGPDEFHCGYPDGRTRASTTTRTPT